MTHLVHLLLLCCIGFAKCESNHDKDHLDLLQRAAKQDEVDDVVDDDDADADDLNDDDTGVDDLSDSDDDLDDLDEDETSGVSVCAYGEGQTCQCTGTVYYGRKYVNGRPGGGATTSLSQLRSSGFKSLSISGQVSCSNGGMGGDPLYGYYKYCFCEAASAPASSASPFVCGYGEGANCQCDGTVYYGAKFVGGRPGGGQTTSFDQLKSRGHRTKSVSGWTSCSNGGMGGDPLYGFYKYCYCLPRETPSPTPSPTARPTPSPTPSPTGECKKRCDKIHSKWAKRGKASKGVDRACKKKFCVGCSICR